MRKLIARRTGYMSEVIYGAGGHARELAFQLEAQGRKVLAFIDDFDFGREIGSVSVVTFDEALNSHKSATWHMAIGNIAARRKLLAKMESAGLSIGGFISDRAIIAPTATIHPTAQVFGGAVVSDSCEIHQNAIVSFGAVLEHDVCIGANSFICPNCSIAGGVIVGSGVWVGIGSTIRESSKDRQIKIGDNSLIGAASCVLDSIPEKTVAYGVPAKCRSKSSANFLSSDADIHRDVRGH